MTEVTFTVHGTAAPQGSKRAFVRAGRAHLVESSDARVKSWRGAVVDAALGAVAEPFPGPAAVTVTFRLKRPKGHYRTGKNSALLRDSAPAYPAGTPDLDKLLRATMDGLTAAGAWRDDAQVVIVTAAKLWADDGLPGADITIRTAP
jgi:crossover junction endodeoxyribonuclease RusA